MYYSITLITIFEVLLEIVPMLLVVAFITVAERKTMASMQRRLGPNYVGFMKFNSKIDNRQDNQVASPPPGRMHGPCGSRSSSFTQCTFLRLQATSVVCPS